MGIFSPDGVQSEAIKAIAARHKGLKIAVFGRVARGEDGPDNDVDLISRGGLKARDFHIREESMAL